MKKITFILLIFFVLTSCISKKSAISKAINTTLASSFYKNQFTGILVIDAKTKDTIYNQDSHKYFIPASNTKIFTLFAALKTLPKKAPAIRYINIKDTLYFEGTGDPSFLHPYLKDSTALNFLKNQSNLAFVSGNFQDEKYGAGWAWDDYQWYYSPERNALPINGNVVVSYKNTELVVSPPYFKDSVIEILHKDNRNEFSNIFYYPPQSKDTLETPFITSLQTSTSILEQALGKKISTVVTMPIGNKETLYGIETDTLYKRMMHESDNFIAEQLLFMAASELKDTLNSNLIRTHILENELQDLAQQPRWVDGSGLSRYNLFTPQNMVNVLDRLYVMVSEKRLYTIFPAGGLSGTLKNRFAGDKQPYIYAKSGSLSNNYCLSGYLLTKSGKTLIFSFMNNHFRESLSDERLRLEQMLHTLRDNY
ncbi:D-alanyl-D-alanine carboxypeptidase/D-alanyl-D-alanine-endopeptidase [Maribacter arcticus]|uniref:D-alanyl-D-alanine carboxypeptidase / D-alanyl-D-alanine-endopeptidase (Penicillin-binding protein 4) n=1 Tax=Maribacter arcticus TaxID=561365 RepID=A0A1T5CTT0_9FLAO|nr:D-alanyl-D-alanine carboxypeptidase [Maribacter arcticus]SKB62777.1 D-alanyl-D-alanine carboxypeptidase / D-alanyl-D-alanine-endopeptidase (penicillin-binding protein 4) [Maribacter arcticus]|tara:strand:+ start:3339 stop:4607 length:1269 start_codon:yes stop_codon:yes gene_type:complete